MRTVCQFQSLAVQLVGCLEPCGSFGAYAEGVGTPEMELGPMMWICLLALRVLSELIVSQDSSLLEKKSG